MGNCHGYGCGGKPAKESDKKTESGELADETFALTPAHDLESEVAVMLRTDPELSTLRPEACQALLFICSTLEELRLLDRAALQGLGLKIGDRGKVLEWSQRTAPTSCHELIVGWQEGGRPPANILAQSWRPRDVCRVPFACLCCA